MKKIDRFIKKYNHSYLKLANISSIDQLKINKLYKTILEIKKKIKR